MYSQYYKQRGKFILKGFVMSIIIGFVAGLSGGIIGSSLYTAQVFDDQPVLPNITFEPSRDLQIDQKKLQETQLGIVSVYKKKSANSSLLLQNIYKNSEVIGYAGALTSDGIIFSHAELFNQPGSYIAKSANDTWFEVTDIVTDKATGIAFAKLTALTPGQDVQLTPLTVEESSDAIVANQNVLLISQDSGVERGLIHDPGHFIIEAERDYIFSSDFFSKRVITQGLQVTERQLLFNEDFVLIGISSPSEGQDVFIPAYAIRDIVDEIFKGEEINRLALGASYLDLSIVDLPESDLPQKGAYLYTDTRFGKYAATGLAREMGLQAGDIITSINGKMITSQKGLSQVLLEYSDTDSLDFEVIRDGELIHITNQELIGA